MLLTREPGGSPGAEQLRALLLSGEANFSLQAEALLHFAARADHIARTIRPALEAGIWVVSDRFADSTMAYQGYGQDGDRSTIVSLDELMGLHPDLTLVLDIEESVAASRRAARGERPDRYERLDDTFHKRVRAGFRAIAEADPTRCVLVAAEGTEIEVHRRIMAIVNERLKFDGAA